MGAGWAALPSYICELHDDVEKTLGRSNKHCGVLNALQRLHAAREIRLASEEHALQIAEMSREYIEYGLGWNWTESRVLKQLRDPETDVVVAVEADEVRAFGIMSCEEDEAHLLLLTALPKYRRHGLGSSIATWFEAAARVAGARRIQVECRRSKTPARNLYVEHGYHETVIEPRMYRQSEDGIRLEK